MDDKVKTWVDGKLVDLTDAMREELARHRMPGAPLGKSMPARNLNWRRKLLFQLMGAEHPLYSSAEALLSWGWLPFALLMGLGAWLHFSR